jgi:sugar phosphate isomerase/epimerase
LSINTISSISQPMADDLAMLKRLGAHQFGFPMLKIEKDLEPGLAAIEGRGIAVTSVAASSATSAMIDADTALSIIKPAVDAAVRLGAPMAYITSGTTPPGMSTDEAFNRLAASLPKSRDYAKAHNVKLAVENNSIANRSLGFTHTLTDTLWLANEADVGVTLELQNCWYERDLPSLFRQNIHRIAMVQVSDFKVGEDTRMNRRVPGDGNIPLKWLFAELLEAGYAGPFEVEIIGPSITAEGPEQALLRTIEYLDAMLAELGV